MLSVSLNLARLVQMLFDIGLPGNHLEVDSLNGPTFGLIPGGSRHVVADHAPFNMA
jgi:hypothetical protein